MKETKRNFAFLSWPLLAICLTVFIITGCDEDAPQPVADFSYVVDEETGVIVTFTNESENAVSHAWNFGVPGATSTLESPEHTYTASGAYTVTLTATNIDGATSIKSKTIALVAIPQNLLVNGNFVDNSNWTVHIVEFGGYMGWSSHTEWTMNNGLTITAQNEPGNLRAMGSLYQQMELEAGTYEIRSSVELSESEAIWFYISVFDTPIAEGVTVPEHRKGEAQEGQATVLNVNLEADECYGISFTGDFADMPCIEETNPETGQPYNGVFQIETAGTYYFYLTAGMWESSFGNFQIKELGLYKVL